MSDNKTEQFTPDADGFYTMEAAKKLGTPGMKFRTPKGSIGTVLEKRSEKGKLRAELTCTAGGPNHVREVSDWHQCSVSPEMKSKAKKKTATASPTETVAQAQSVRESLEKKLAEVRAKSGLPAQPSPEAVAEATAETEQQETADEA